jgi:ABC-type nickel/cobalt efflux system permease component RcnA
MNRVIGRAAAIALLSIVIVPAIALAHPLGNFTINHYAGLRVEPDRVVLDVVVDQAEIPAFRARLEFDLDGDGSVSAAETAIGRVTACTRLADDLVLNVDAKPAKMRLTSAGLSFPPGVGGLSTLRLACGFDADLPAVLSSPDPARITFTDGSYPDRLGWREIVTVGSGAIVSTPEGVVRSTSPSDRLTAYPDDLVAQPLADLTVTIDAIAGGPALPAWTFADAVPVAQGGDEGAAAAGTTGSGEVPGGVQGEIPSIFSTAELTPVVFLLSIATAIVLGAGHALTPGHGKTLMAAYLVGTRGTPLHAVGLGLSVSLSHTVGILILAVLVVGAADVLPPDLVVRGAPVVAAASFLAIGAWMLVGELRRRRRTAATALSGHREHDHDHPHDHADVGHTHGGIRHGHLPASGSSMRWRSLFVLGLAGGLVPSTSALLILLGSIASGRQAFGIVLVVAFGLGMAAVMTAIGLVMVVARDRVGRLPAGDAIGRLREFVPVAAAVLVFGFGIYLTAQALGGAPSL